MRKQAEMAARRERWSRIVERAEASGLPIRQFCQQHDVDEGQFYHWRHRLELEAPRSKAKEAAPGFVLVQPAKPVEPTAASEPPAALELVLERGWRLRIASPVDEATLRAVLKALGAPA